MSDYAKIHWQKLVLAVAVSTAELCDLLAKNKKAEEGTLGASLNRAKRKEYALQEKWIHYQNTYMFGIW